MKIHYKNLCNVEGRHGRKTSEIMDEVTCKFCLDKIKKYKLVPKSGFPEIPTFEVKAQGYYKNSEDSKPRCHLVFRCPVCGKENSHGGYYNEKGAADGHRSSHCQCWPHGYNIKEV